MTSKILATLFATTAFLSFNVPLCAVTDDDAPQVSAPQATPREAHYKAITEALDGAYNGLGSRLVNFAKTKEGQVWDERVARLAAPETLTLFTKEDYWIKYGNDKTVADYLQEMKNDQSTFLLGCHAPLLTHDLGTSPADVVAKLGKWPAEYVANFFDHAGQILHMKLSTANYFWIIFALETIEPSQMTKFLDAINKHSDTLFNPQMSSDDRANLIRMLAKIKTDDVAKFCSEIPVDWGRVIKKDGMRDIVSALDGLNPQVALAIIQNAAALFPTEMDGKHRVALIEQEAQRLYKSSTVILPKDAVADVPVADSKTTAAETATTSTTSESSSPTVAEESTTTQAPAVSTTTAATTAASSTLATSSEATATPSAESTTPAITTTDESEKPTPKKKRKVRKSSKTEGDHTKVDD